MKAPLALLVVAVLAGCAPMRDAPPALATVQPARLGLVDSRVEWPQAQWWQRYDDPQLNSLVQDALAGSPSIDRARARLAQANAAVGSARAPLLPSLSANYGLTRQRLSENYIYPAPLAGSVTTDQRLALDLSYELDFWGKHRHGLEAAVARQQAAQTDVQAARIMLAYGVVQAYLNLQTAFAQQKVLEDIGRQRRELLDLTSGRFDNGLDTQVEVRQAQSALAQAEVQIVQTRTRIAQLRNQIAALTGNGPDRAAALVPVVLAAPAGTPPAALPLALVGRRPDVVAARWRAQAATQDIDVAKSLFYPNVNLTAFIGFQAIGLHNLIEAGSKMGGVGPAISLPIFQGGALNANLDARRAASDEATADYNDTLITAVRQVADALDALRMLADERAAQTQARTSIEAAYALALDRYKAGLGNYLTVLIAQNDVMAQAQRDTDLRMRAYQLDADLARALGGGYDEPMPE